MEQVPSVSLDMPVYNGTAYLDGTIDAIPAQTFGDYSRRNARIRYSPNEQNLNDLARSSSTAKVRLCSHATAGSTNICR